MEFLQFLFVLRLTCDVRARVRARVRVRVRVRVCVCPPVRVPGFAEHLLHG